MRNQNHETGKSLLRLCAALCVCLLCAGFVCPVPGHAAGPVSTPAVIRRLACSPSPDPAGGLPAFVLIYYVNERGTVVLEEKRRLTGSCLVEAAPEDLPDDYELADSEAVYVLVENGTASPVYVEFSVRKKASPSPAPTTPAPLFSVNVPVRYVCGGVTVFAGTWECRSGETTVIPAQEDIYGEDYLLSGSTAAYVYVGWDGSVNPEEVVFTLTPRATPSPEPTPAPTDTPMPVFQVEVPVCYQCGNTVVAAETVWCRSGETAAVTANESLYGESYILSGSNTVYVYVSGDGTAAPEEVVFALTRKTTPVPVFNVEVPVYYQYGNTVIASETVWCRSGETTWIYPDRSCFGSRYKLSPFSIDRAEVFVSYEGTVRPAAVTFQLALKATPTPRPTPKPTRTVITNIKPGEWTSPSPRRLTP